MIETSQEELLMPPQEQSFLQPPVATYTLEQVQTLMQMERDRVNQLVWTTIYFADQIRSQNLTII